MDNNFSRATRTFNDSISTDILDRELSHYVKTVDFESYKNEVTNKIHNEIKENQKINDDHIKELNDKISKQWYWFGGVVVTSVLAILAIIFN